VDFKQVGDPNANVILKTETEGEFRREENTRSLFLGGKFLHGGIRSHVLLAACGEEQSALEKAGSGVFTTALLSLWKTCGIEDHTYAEIIMSLGNLAK
jgi:hypothetical protein